VSRYQKGKTNLDFTEARDSEWQWHPLGHMQVCTSSRQITMPAPHHSVAFKRSVVKVKPFFAKLTGVPNTHIDTQTVKRATSLAVSDIYALHVMQPKNKFCYSLLRLYEKVNNAMRHFANLNQTRCMSSIFLAVLLIELSVSTGELSHTVILTHVLASMLCNNCIISVMLKSL